MYDRIVVPTDDSDHARRAARHAFALAAAFDASVDAVHVIDTKRVAGPFDAGGVSDEYLDRVAADREDVVEGIAALAGEGVGVRTAVLRGRPAARILEYVSDVNADLVVMGTRGQSGLKRSVLGSVAERVIRQASVPVLATSTTDREQRGVEYGDVLVPTDGSDTAREAVPHGVAVAEATDAAVHGVAVVDEAMAPAGPIPVDGGAVHESPERAARAATETVVARARDVGLDATHEVREGRPGREIRGYAREHGVDLVVMGAHGRAGLDRLVLGSTTEWVVRHTDLPVMTVPA